MSMDWRSEKRLPEDPAYWDHLAARFTAAAFGHARAGERFVDARTVPSATVWWRDIADSAYVLAASAIVAIMGGALLLGERTLTGTAESHAIAGALAPDDPLLRTLMDAPADAPAATTLLTLIAAREEEP